METVVSAMFGVVLERLGSAGVKQFMKLLNKGKKTNEEKIIEEWKGELLFIQEMLNDAELNRSTSGAVRLWLENLKDFACDLEDTLDDFVDEALTHHLKTAHDSDDLDAVVGDGLTKRGRGVRAMVGSVLACGRGSTRQFRYSGPDFSSRIDEISRGLKQLQTRAATLGLSTHIIQQPTYPLEGQHSGRRESTSVISEDIVYGRDEEKKHIIHRLIKDEPNYMNYVVIPIVGMGGIGKTTLAQCVYNDEQLNGHFNLKAWVCVSDVFDVKRITKDIIGSATKGNFDCSSLNQAQEKLQQELTDKKFLVVLDDIWSEEYGTWDQLQVPFQFGARGSRVIVTTRNEKIANMVMNSYCHSNIIYLKCLSDEDCWCLFKRHAVEYADLSKRKDDIVQKCKGLPLASKSLGGLLRKTTVKSERMRILDSNIWNEESSVLPVLRLSYHHLPSHLKHLFAYCSVLPKDYKFEEMEVIKLWMAQDFLPDNKNERMEDKGHGCFLDLVSRSLFEEVEGLSSRRFTMHDLIHDLANWAAGDICCVLDTMNMHKDLRRTRHLFVTVEGVVETFGNQVLVSRLRTFLYSSYAGLNIELQSFRYVRTLRIASWKILELPECIGELKHLQFLALFLRKIKLLPKSIGKLWNLQTLECHCRDLHEVPSIRFLINLRHLSISERSLQEMPLGIGYLTNLQSLSNFVLAAGGGSRISEMKNLNHLHESITISGLGCVTKFEYAKEAQLHEKKSLDELYLDWGTCGDKVDDKTKRDIVEHLQPHTSIKKCVLKGYMGLAFPSWLGDPSFKHMVDIKLENCEKCECLPSLGQLPLLENLHVADLNGIKEVGPEFYGHCSTPFPVLRTLCFERMKAWEKWVHPPVDNNGAFPCLEMLIIEKCHSLQGDLPPLNPCLKKLGICYCPELSPSLPSLPLLEVLEIKGCKVLSINGDVSICSKRVILRDISEITGLPGHFPNLREELTMVNCHPSPIIIDQIPVVLRRLEISHCREVQSLKFENSYSLTPCLEYFMVSHCESIVSISNIPLMLQSLRIHSCDKLREVELNEIPKELSGNDEKTEEGVGLSRKASLELRLLTDLRVRHCPSLISLREGLLLPALKYLHFSHFSNMAKLPCELHNLLSLQSLEIAYCPQFLSFTEFNLPRDLRELSIKETNIEVLVKEWGLHLLTSLQYLTLEDVGSSTDSVECIDNLLLPSSLYKLQVKGFQNLKTISCSTHPNLTKIHIRSCPKFESIDGDFTSLTKLTLENINLLIQEWGLHLLTSLKYLILENIGSSVDSVVCISNLVFPSSLSSLEINGFRNLKTIICSPLPKLTKIDISSCPKFESLDGDFTSLSFLALRNCPLFRSFPERGLPRHLWSFSICEASIEVLIQEWGLLLLTSLQYLTLENVGSCSDSVECISNLLLPSSLYSLRIKGFRNLKNISCSTLPNLTFIRIKSCPKLESFGDNGLPQQIRKVSIEDCDSIEQHLKSDPRMHTENGSYLLF